MRAGALILVTVFVVAASPAGAQAKLIGSASDNGPAPFADASGELRDPVGGLRLVVSTSSALPVDIGIDLQCERGVHRRRVTYKLPPAPAPLERRVAVPMKRADQCHVDIDAGFYEEATEERELHPLEGEVVVQIFGRSRLRPR